MLQLPMKACSLASLQRGKQPVHIIASLTCALDKLRTSAPIVCSNMAQGPQDAGKCLRDPLHIVAQEMTTSEIHRCTLRLRYPRMLRTRYAFPNQIFDTEYTLLSFDFHMIHIGI